MSNVDLKSVFMKLTGLEFSYSSFMQVLNFSLALMLVFFLPLHQRAMLIIVFFWFVTWLLELDFRKKIDLVLRNRKKYFVLTTLLLFYFIHITGYFYSSNIPAALFDLEVKLSLLLMPVVFISTNQLYRQHRRFLLWFFLSGLFVASLICLAVAFINSTGLINGKMIFSSAIAKQYVDESFFMLVGHRLSLFSYTRLSVFMHPAYFSMYLIFGVVVCYYFYRILVKKKHKLLFLFAMAFFYIMVYLLSTRAGLLSLSATLISLTVIELVRKKNYALVFFISFVLNYGLYLAMTISPLNKNVVEVKKWVESETISGSKKKAQESISENSKPSDGRFYIWESAIDVVKDNFIFGTGTGDVKDSLIGKYNQNGFKRGVERRYNAHNQYLNAFVGLGLIGFLFLMLMLGAVFRYSLKYNRILLSFLVSLVAFNFLFESMLDKAAGVIFFAFFVSYLIIYSPTPIKQVERILK